MLCSSFSVTALPLSALRLSSFSSPRFSSTSTTSSEHARSRAPVLFFPRFSALLSLAQPNPPSLPSLPACLPAWLPRSPMSPFCYSFCPARLRVFLARLLPLPDPFILLPGLPLSPSAFRHFSLFLYLFPSDPPPPTPSSFSFTLALCFSAGLACSFPFLSPVFLSQFSGASLLYPLDVVFPVLLYSFLRLMITGITLPTAFPFGEIAPRRLRFN